MLAARPELFTRTYTIADFAKVATSAAVGQRLRPSGGRPEDPVAVTFAPRGLEGYEDRPTFHIARQVAAGAAAAAAAATKATSCLTRIASRLTRGTAAASAAVAAAVAEEGNVANYLPRFLNLAVRIANHISGRKSFVVYDDRFAEVSTYSLGTSIHDDDLSLDMLVSPGAGWLTGDGTLLFEVVVYSFLDGVLANDQAAAARILTEHMNGE